MNLFYRQLDVEYLLCFSVINSFVIVTIDIRSIVIAFLLFNIVQFKLYEI